MQDAAAISGVVEYSQHEAMLFTVWLSTMEPTNSFKF